MTYTDQFNTGLTADELLSCARAGAKARFGDDISTWPPNQQHAAMDDVASFLARGEPVNPSWSTVECAVSARSAEIWHDKFAAPYDWPAFLASLPPAERSYAEGCSPERIARAQAYLAKENVSPQARRLCAFQCVSEFVAGK